MKKTISEIVSELQKDDVYSILCSFLFELKQVPEYSLISELCYSLDRKSFFNLVKYYGGQTIRIPTPEELVDTMRVLLLLQYYEIEKMPWKDAVVLAGFDTSSGKLAHNKLNKLKEVFKKYNIGNREY